jgi:hypothetical protein
MQAIIPSTTEAALNAQCTLFRSELNATFVQVCRQGLTDRLTSIHANQHRAKSWIEVIAYSIFGNRQNADLIPAFSLTASVNDTTHDVLRSMDISRALWDIPYPLGQSEDQMFVSLKRDVSTLFRSFANDPSVTNRRKRVVRKGLEALDDMDFIMTTQNFGCGEITIRTILSKLYNVMRKHVDKDEMLIASCDELYHSREAGFGAFVPEECKFHGCQGGIASRTFNALRGFCSIPSMPVNPTCREGFA